MKPLIVQSPLTAEWYVVTRYTLRENGLLIAHRKYDVTGQVETIIHDAILAKKKKRKRP